jgi:hypothetical protein
LYFDQKSWKNKVKKLESIIEDCRAEIRTFGDESEFLKAQHNVMMLEFDNKCKEVAQFEVWLFTWFLFLNNFIVV